jgi:type II secretory pathway component PulM
VAQRELSTRERILVIGAVVVFLSIVTVPFARALASDYRQGRAELEEARARLRDASQLHHAIEAERAAKKLIAERIGAGGKFSLYDFTQSTLTRAGMGERMRLEKRGAASQSLEVVSVSLNGVGLNQLIEFLHATYSADRPVAVQQLDFLRPARDGKGLDCSMTLMSPRL